MNSNLPIISSLFAEVIIPTLIIVLIHYLGGRKWALVGILLMTLTKYLQTKYIEKNLEK